MHFLKMQGLEGRGTHGIRGEKGIHRPFLQICRVSHHGRSRSSRRSIVASIWIGADEKMVLIDDGCICGGRNNQEKMGGRIYFRFRETHCVDMCWWNSIKWKVNRKGMKRPLAFRLWMTGHREHLPLMVIPGLDSSCYFISNRGWTDLNPIV